MKCSQNVAAKRAYFHIFLPLRFINNAWQDQRDRIIERFRSGEIWVLICTDLMARGIDFKVRNLSFD